ncbi:stonustoxin subunit alpha-like isoform X2 [Trematomus bernacchii]|nr:stonustoxin subunit alpha-like isoform X2 [Trematomus bernacchii]XP_033976830.1 stonustoxin subunit alpha-like isoform X2 [Trematomus bernacchii]XP_033976831.1 stonustoxin subunit alpha-like isoform X2 [Trematomus bernacchii]
MDSEGIGTIEVAALGRPFSLGMLYDCRKDELIAGITLWNHEDLKNDIGERPQSYNDCDMVASESIEDKSSALNVEASLKASFLGGLINVEGSAKYLKDTKTSKNQARVTLKYQATTKFQQLSMNHLGKDNLDHTDVFEKGIATHVVTGILYGARAFFVFDREVSVNENHQDIQGNLKVMIKKIPHLSIEGEGSLKMEDKDKTNVEKFSCRFFGDFLIQKPPTSFQEAVEVYQSLPKLLGANGENAVPVKVWLMPLTYLNDSAAKLVRQISTGLVEECQTVLEDFSDLDMRFNDALRTQTAQQFPQIGEKLKTFKQMCSEFKLEFQRTLAKKLPSIRGGGEEEAVLAEELRKTCSSPFNSKDLNEWMDCKEREIYTVMSLTDMMTNTKIISSQTDLCKESFKAEEAVCFVFTSLGSDEPYLSTLSNYLKQTPKPDVAQDPHPPDQWYNSRKEMEAMRHKAKLFSDFAEANKDNKNITFLTVGLANETQKGASIHLYKDGFPVNENFELPSKPVTVTGSDIVSPPRFGAEDISSYSDEYCVSVEDSWKQKTGQKPAHLTEFLISKSKKINSESPSVYKLPLKEDDLDIDGCRRYNFGTESLRQNRTIMLLGATGSGKSTLINGLINYIVGVEWKDDFRFKLVDEDQSRSQAESQTSEVTVYKINHQEGFKIPFSLTVVDTPGFGDTSITRYKEITEQLLNLFSAEHGVSEIDAVCFVAQASLAQLTPTQKYVFDSVLSILGKDVAENIQVLVTFSDGQPPPILDSIKALGVPCPKTEDGLPVNFKFNNSALFAQNQSSAAADSSVDEEDGGFDQMFWKMGAQSMKRFFVALNKITTKSLTMTKEVLRERQQLQISDLNLKKNVETLDQVWYFTGFPHSKVFDAINLSFVEIIKGSLECQSRLEKIALVPYPPDYIGLRIEGEKAEAKEGWEKRVQYLMERRGKAEAELMAQEQSQT